MTWRYKEFLQVVDTTIGMLDSPKLEELWHITKEDVKTFSDKIAIDESVSAEGLYYLIWSRWEDLFTAGHDMMAEYDEDEEELMVFEAPLMMAVLEFKQGCPDHLWPVVHHAVEVGFGVARGFTKAEATAQQDEFIASQGGWEAFYHPQNVGLDFLTVIEGGKHG
jgi:hypothetical protein